MQIVIARVNQREYGIPIETVMEVVRGVIAPVTGPAVTGLEGTIQLRTGPVPVINLRKLFGLDGGGFNPEAMVIVTRRSKRSLGMLVEAVIGVRSVESLNPVGKESDVPEQVSAVAMVGPQKVYLLDLERVERATVRRGEAA